MTAAGQDAVDAFDATIDEYLEQGRETGLLLKRMDDVDPDMVMSHVLRGYFLVLGSRPHLLSSARDSLAKAEALAAQATPREQAHVRALAVWITGDLRRTKEIWEEILLEHPHDILAFRLAHFLHFFVGDLVHMRDSSVRALPHWSNDIPGYGYVLGCRAFSLEENGMYGDAEPLGRQAVELNENDIWAGHAVAHVLEMQGRRQDGITWIDAHETAWKARGIFAHHLWWHRSLHYLELERFDDVLHAFDTQFWSEPSDDNTDIANASSILMRLVMLGLDVGERWKSIAERCESRVDDLLRPFNDIHFMMALAMGGRRADALKLLSGMKDSAQTQQDGDAPTRAAIYRDAGVPVAEAILAYADKDYGRVVDILREGRYWMRPLGGSWAQRDCWVRMLIDAAIRDGQDSLARALLAERTAANPTSAPSWQAYGDVLKRLGATAEAATAHGRAANLLAA